MALEMTGRETDAPRCPRCVQLWRAMWYCPHGAYRCGIWQTQPQRARRLETALARAAGKR